MNGGGVVMDMNKVLIWIIVDIIVLVILGLLLYKAIQSASKNKIEGLEKEAETLLENAKREAEATKKESIQRQRKRFIDLGMIQKGIQGKEEMKFKDLKEE